MKNKRIFLVFILSALFLFALAGTSKASNSIYDGSGSYTNFEVKTKIERWSPANDLVFVKNDSWSSEWYTKRVFLRGKYDGSDVEYEINESSFEEISTYSNTYSRAIALKDMGPFTPGSDVYLVEKYNVSSIASNTSSLEAGLDGHVFDDIPSNDRLVFDIDDSYIVSEAMTNYPSSFDKKIYIDTRYQSGDPSDGLNRDLYLYVYMKDNSGSKTDEISKGTIELPIFRVDTYFTATGNTMPAGTFTMPSAMHAPDWGTNDPDISSGYGRTIGRALYNSEYSLISYRDVQSLDDNSITYSWSSEERIATSSNSISISPSLSGRENYDNHIYAYTLSGSATSDKSAPNGIFYNVVPFVVAGVIAVAGIIVFKRRSTK